MAQRCSAALQRQQNCRIGEPWTLRNHGISSIVPSVHTADDGRESIVMFNIEKIVELCGSYSAAE
jgi:hypothetical protein